MNSLRRCFAFLLAVLLVSGLGTAAQAQSARAVAASARISAAVETGVRARLPGHVPNWANSENDLGGVAPGLRLDNLHLILARAPEVQAAFEQLLADQQNPASARYHQWLTPQQNAEQYGIAPGDLAAVTAWLQSQGLSLDGVADGGVFITFSGPASLVESTFATSLHNFSHENAARRAPVTDIAVPAALAGVIQTVDGLAEEVAHVHSHAALADSSADGPQPLFNAGSGIHYLSPGDFNTIYDINPTFNTGINGAGNRVVNLISSRVVASDITGFNSVFGLSVAQPNTIVVPSSTDPGVNADSEGEAALDVQRILGTAPGVSVDLLVFANLSFTNIFSALQYEVGTLNDPVVNMSFGACNAGSSFNQSASFDSYFKAGAAQGISFFVSSGDDAAAGCDGDTIPTLQVLSTNLICASSYATCVGGTEFAETSSANWSSVTSATKVSANGYIPEGAWDEPTFVSGGRTTYQASGTGGGLTLFAKPTWQTGTGVPVDGIRDVPDVSFTSSYHDGYLVCQADVGNVCSSDTFRYITFGTSASSPSMAGIAALLDEKLGTRQGNLNPLFYRLAATSSNNVFHDVTVASSGVVSCSTAIPSICNNSTPSANSLTGGLAGYAVGPGYDLATGLGSLDVTSFIAAAGGTSGPTLSTSLTLKVSLNPATTSQTVIFTATMTSSSSSPVASGTVQFYSNGSALGSAVSLTAARTAATAALSFPTPGVFTITAVYSGDGTYIASTASPLPLVVTVTNAPGFTLASPSTLSVNAGSTSGSAATVTVTSVNGFAGMVALSCAISGTSGASPPECAIVPGSVTLASGATATAAVTITTASAHSSAGRTERPDGPAGRTFLALLLCLLPLRGRAGLRRLAMVLLLVAGLTSLFGCGAGGNSIAPAVTGSSTANYTVTITGTGTAAGGLNAVTVNETFALTVD
jgi:subtilase family serine protease